MLWPNQNCSKLNMLKNNKMSIVVRFISYRY